MLIGLTRGGILVCVFVSLSVGVLRAQSKNPHDASLAAMRSRATIGPSDQRRIADWVREEVSRFKGFAEFRKRFDEQYHDPNNSSQFSLQIAVQTAKVAAADLGAKKLRDEAAQALVQVLIDMDRPETVPGLIAGLGSHSSAARYLCARGLALQRNAIASDQATFDQVVAAIRDAGLHESDPVVLERIYDALGYIGQLPVVFDVYLKLFDQRLAYRRGAVGVADGAERTAFEFFRQPAVLGALNADQKTQLVRRLAVFLRIDAQRYQTPKLDFYEVDRLERMLDAVEEILARLVPTGGGHIRDQLASGGYSGGAAVVKEAYRWVGQPKTNAPGALNKDPWNVPLGAP